MARTFGILRQTTLNLVVIYLVLSIIAIGALPGDSSAYIAGPEALENSRHADLAVVQRTLESRLVEEKLLSLGLTPEETAVRLALLSDEELHSFAMELEGLNPGGSFIGVVIGLLVIAILVVVLLNMTGHKVSIGLGDR